MNAKDFKGNEVIFLGWEHKKGVIPASTDEKTGEYHSEVNFDFYKLNFAEPVNVANDNSIVGYYGLTVGTPKSPTFYKVKPDVIASVLGLRADEFNEQILSNHLFNNCRLSYNKKGALTAIEFLGD